MLKTFEKLEKSSCSNCVDMSCAVALLNKNEFELLSDNSMEVKVKKGDIILRSDSLVSNIIYLKTGHVKEFVVDYNGNSQIIQIIKPYTYLGLHSLFGDKINHYSYAALEDLKICYIEINTFKQLIKGNGNFAYQILVSICQENLQNYFRFISKNQKQTDGKLAEILLYLSENIYESPKFNLQLSRQELSDLIGISRENASRAITKFKNDGIISIAGNQVKILKIDLLKKISTSG